MSRVIGGGHTDSEGEQSREDLYRMTWQTDEPNFVAPKIVHTLFFLVVYRRCCKISSNKRQKNRFVL